MPYNRGMTQITLALPYALPPPELAPDLLRALKTPALAMLLSRHGALQRRDHSPTSRVLPHEAWLAQILQLASPPATGAAASAAPRASGPLAASAPLATAAMHGYGLAPQPGRWFILQPVHVQLSRTHLLLADPRQLHLADDEARPLFELARPYFEDLGKTLVYGSADLWFVRADDWSGLDTASPDAAVAQNLSDWVPEGAAALAYRKLQNEIQMLWHEHPVNQARQARGLAPVNSFWLWAGADSSAAPGRASAGAAAAPAAAATAAKSLAIAGAPSWMMALAAPELRAAGAAQVIERAGQSGAANVMLADLISSAVAGDWSDWLAHMQRIEQEWCAPLLDALQAGRIGSVTLLLSHRNASIETTTSKLALRKFWRKPTLNLLKQA